MFTHTEIDKMEMAFDAMIEQPVLMQVPEIADMIEEYELHHFQAFSTSNTWSESYYKGKLDAYREILRAVEGE